MQEFMKYQNSRMLSDWQQIINQTNQFNQTQQPLNRWDQISDQVIIRLTQINFFQRSLKIFGFLN